jgi:hypothetical protein
LGVTLLVVHVLKTDLLLKVQNHVHQLSRNAVLLISEERVDFDSSSIFVDHDSLEMFIFKRALVFMLLFPCRSTYLGFDRACQRLYCFTCGIPYQYVPSSLVDQLINEITPPHGFTWGGYLLVGGVLGWYVGVTVWDLFRGGRPIHPVYLKVKKFLTPSTRVGFFFFVSSSEWLEVVVPTFFVIVFFDLFKFQATPPGGEFFTVVLCGSFWGKL